MSSSQYEFTMKADELQELKEWEPKIRRSLSRLSELEDINTDYEDRGLQTSVVMDREALSRLGLTVRDVDNALANALLLVFLTFVNARSTSLCKHCRSQSQHKKQGNDYFGFHGLKFLSVKKIE
jgi:multidrug efflux pump subunit AcrB